MARSRIATPKPASRRTTPAGKTLYLVRRLYESGWESIFCNSAAAECPQRSEWGAPVKAFKDQSRAAVFCEELGNKLLKGKNPFKLQSGELKDLTTFPPGPFRDWLRDVGLEPPPPNKNQLEHWSRWWKNQSDMSAEQRHQVLVGLNKLRFYDVVGLEPPAGPAPRRRGKAEVTVFSVDLLIWKDDDDFLAGYEGDWLTSVEPCFSERGLRLATFRDHDRATAYRDQLQRQVPQPRGFFRNGFGVTEQTVEVED
jgi:hypothetical protein